MKAVSKLNKETALNQIQLKGVYFHSKEFVDFHNRRNIEGHLDDLM